MKAMPISILGDIEENPDLVVGRKFSGFKEFLHIDDKGRIRVICRSGADHTANVPSISRAIVHLLADTILACEGIAPSDKIEDAKSIFGSSPEYARKWQEKNGLARFIVFDIKKVFGGPVEEEFSFGERRGYIRAAVEVLRSAGLKNIYQEVLLDAGKKRYFDEVVAGGGEGLVVKSLKGQERNWFKVKKVKTWDAVIIGFTRGKGKYGDVIGAIRYGAYDSGVIVEVGKCSGMKDAERKMFAEKQEDFIGTVIEIKGQELGNRGAIVFPRFVRLRPDKLPKECLLESFV